MAEQKTVATPIEAVLEMCPDWELTEALLCGTRHMRGAGEKYLPRWPNEDQKSYAARLAVAVLYPAYSRTVTTLAAKPFSKPLKVEDDVPAKLVEWLDDIDMQGRNLHVFASDCMELMLGPGLGCILVDYPDASKSVQPTAAGVVTQAEEQRAGLRPYWLLIKPRQIIGWRAERVRGEWTLNQFRFMECVEEPDGEFGTMEIEQVRVLEPGKWRTFRQDTNDPRKWVLHDEGTTTLQEVPIVPLYGVRTGFMAAKPPLIELAHLSVAHWQSSSDQQNILHVARVPILTVTGVQDGIGQNGEAQPWTFSIGASAAVKLPMGATMAYVEHTGKAVEAGAAELETLEQRMRQAGAELLVLGPSPTTRIEAAADNEVATCALQRMTQALEDALDEALDITARWVGEATGGHVTLFSDFGALTLGDAQNQLIADMEAAGVISKQTAFEESQRRGVLAADRTWEEEQARLEGQGPPMGTLGNPAASDLMTGGAAADSAA